MNYPNITSENLQERAGVYRVAQLLSLKGIIFRETSNTDVGIDGQIEWLSKSGQATGQILAVQIKSGISFFRNKEKEDYWKFYPNKKHLKYWEAFPIPVVILLHHPETDNVYYQDIRFYLRNPNNDKCKFISIPKNQVINNTDDGKNDFIMQYFKKTNQSLFDLSGQLPIDELLDIQELPMVMIENQMNYVTFFDLFVYGITNIGRQVFFSTSLFIQLDEIFALFEEEEYYGGIGIFEHEFLNDFVKFLVKQNIAFVDYSEYLIDKERGIQSQFIAPLTKRGRELITEIHQLEEKIFKTNDNSIFYERTVDIRYADYEIYEMKKCNEFKESMKKKKKT